MKPTLIIGLYCQAKSTAALGSLRTVDGIQTGVLRWHGPGIASALHQILQDAQPIGAPHLSIVCNHAGLVEAFTKPIALALPDVRKEGRKQIPCGNENMWNVARDLARYEHWQIVFSEAPKAKELWEENYGKVD